MFIEYIIIIIIIKIKIHVSISVIRVITVIHQHTPKWSVWKSTSNPKYWRIHIERPRTSVYIDGNIRNIRAIKRWWGSRWSTANIRSGMIHLLVTQINRTFSAARLTPQIQWILDVTQHGFSYFIRQHFAIEINTLMTSAIIDSAYRTKRFVTVCHNVRRVRPRH